MRSIASFLTSKFFIAAAFLCGAVVLLQTGGAYAATPLPPVNVPIEVTIQSSAKVNLQDPLNFGTVEVYGDGEVKIDARTGSGTATAVDDGNGAIAVPNTNAHPGKVELTSDPNINFSYTFTIDVDQVRLSPKLLVKDIRNNSSLGTTPLPHVGGTPSPIWIGGVLEVKGGATTPPGGKHVPVTVTIQ